MILLPVAVSLAVSLAAVAQSSSSSSSSSSTIASASSASTSTASASGAATSSGSLSGSLTAPISSSTLSTVPFTLASTNPTAVPLASIPPGTVTVSTGALPQTAVPGSTPSIFPNAPPLPQISTLNPANYPPLDKPPPIDSPEVQQWIADVRGSGFNIPDTSPNSLGGCANNTAAAANASSAGNCWWTCGHCSRQSDIVSCPDKLTWGMSFDDGPSPSTPNLLQFLDANQLKSTFFVVGSRVISRPQILQSQYASGHHISVHTWSHTMLTTQSTEAIIAELGWSKKVIKDVLGVTPNTMRPPFGDIDDRVRAISLAMGLTPIIWTSTSNFTFDTNDFNIPGGTVSPSQVLVNFETILKTAPSLDTGFIVLEHDLFSQTVELATGYVLPDALAQNPKLSMKTIIECQHRALSDGYIETNDNSTNPPPNPGDAGNAGSAQGGSSKGGSLGLLAPPSSALATFMAMLMFVAFTLLH